MSGQPEVVVVLVRIADALERIAAAAEALEDSTWTLRPGVRGTTRIVRSPVTLADVDQP